jgi:hypothetical protein
VNSHGAKRTDDEERLAMAAILVPGVDPEFPKRWKLADNDPGPRSADKQLFRAVGGSRSDSQGACPSVPGGGPGKPRLDAIVQEARRVGRAHNPATGLEGLAAGAILAENSKTGGKWDIKNLRDEKNRKIYPDGQEFGDFLYGATSTGIGFSPTISDLGADLYSLWSNGTLEDKDEWIRAGQRYARLKCDQR